MFPKTAKGIMSMLREFVERNSNIIDLQFDPRLPPKLLIDPWSKDYRSRMRTAHYFLLVASVDERGVIGRAENARYLIAELHRKFGEKIFQITNSKIFKKEISKCTRYNEFGFLKGQIPDILASVNRFVIHEAKGDLIKFSQRFRRPRDMVKIIGRYVKRMGGTVNKKAWIYMRWMVRPKPDLRIFSHFSPKDLYIPLTSDNARVAVCLGLIKSVEPIRWSDVEKVTRFARELFPEDPVKVDFPFFLIGRWLRGKDLNMQTLKKTLTQFDNFYRKTGFSILITKEKVGYSAECPALPGCITQGDTEEEVLKNMEEAIKSYLETVRKYGIEM